MSSCLEHKLFYQRREKEQRDKAAEQKAQEALQAQREADRIFSEKQQLKVKRIREEKKDVQDFNAVKMVTSAKNDYVWLRNFAPCSLKLVFAFLIQAEKSAKLQQLRENEREFEARKAELIAEEELRFQQYSQQVINAAAEAQRNVVPLCKAAREGIGGGCNPVFSGVTLRYLVQDHSGAQMPKYVSAGTQDIKKFHTAADIQDAKRRLGFT